MYLNVKYENTHSRYIIAENIQDLRLTKNSYTGPQKHDPRRKKNRPYKVRIKKTLV